MRHVTSSFTIWLPCQWVAPAACSFWVQLVCGLNITRPASPPACTVSPGCAQTLLVRALYAHLRVLPACRIARAAKVGRGAEGVWRPCILAQNRHGGAGK